jgi:hypothetical protein
MVRICERCNQDADVPSERCDHPEIRQERLTAAGAAMERGLREWSNELSDHLPECDWSTPCTEGPEHRTPKWEIGDCACGAGECICNSLRAAERRVLDKVDEILDNTRLSHHEAHRRIKALRKEASDE